MNTQVSGKEAFLAHQLDQIKLIKNKLVTERHVSVFIHLFICYLSSGTPGCGSISERKGQSITQHHAHTHSHTPVHLGKN